MVKDSSEYWGQIRQRFGSEPTPTGALRIDCLMKAAHRLLGSTTRVPARCGEGGCVQYRYGRTRYIQDGRGAPGVSKACR